MGSIRPDVGHRHLRDYPDEKDLLTPFLSGFEVTWGRRLRAYNTELSTYFLKPERHITETFGFEQEILLCYSPYDELEPRSIQAAESSMTQEPGKGRVEKHVYFLVSNMGKAKEWVRLYAARNPESRMVVAFSADELRVNRGKPWYVRNALYQQLFGRDLFDLRLPLSTDTYFFGREKLVFDYYDAIGRGENRGLFGLRKTGKTSVLFKLERLVDAEKLGKLIYYDCKSPSIRTLRWNELLAKVAGDIASRYSVRKRRYSFNARSATDSFTNLVAKTPSKTRTILVFDEIEHISPIAVADGHWAKDFVPFWQTVWACQSRHRGLSVIIAGVNPHVAEVDVVDGMQNPLFGIVTFRYLRGFDLDDLRRMIRTLGRRMGLQFDEEAIQYLHMRYGGHPLLTRIACSLVNSKLRSGSAQRPAAIRKSRLKAEEEERDAELVFYCRHVVSELRMFYRNEYELLELLASRQTYEFQKRTAFPETTKHLREYGLVEYDDDDKAAISIPVIGRYVGLELARREGRGTILKVIEPDKRDEWLRRRVDAILNDMRLLERLIDNRGSSSLYGPNSFPEAERFKSLTVCADASGFGNFINVCNRCFVESIENYGQAQGIGGYFWKDVKLGSV